MPKSVTTPYDLLLQLRAKPKRRGLIAKRRRWFDDGAASEGDDNPDGGRDAGGGAGDNDWSSLPDWAQQQYQSLRDKLGEVNNESATRRHEIKALTDKVKALQTDRQGRLTAEEKIAEYEAQIKNLQAAQERADQLEQRIQASNQQRIQGIPEHMRGLVPADEMTAEQLAGWLDKNEAMLRKPIAPPPEGGSGVGRGRAGDSTSLTAEEKRIAARSGMTEEQYAAAKRRAQS